MAIWFTADLHFHHQNILDYEVRPFLDAEEMNEILLENWLSTVQKNDEVYILGDLSFGNSIQISALIKKLSGRKHLILGNHDHLNQEQKKEFIWVGHYKEIKIKSQKIVLFHYPIYSWNGKEKEHWHFHGHTHKASHESFAHPLKVNVGVDHWHYKPVRFDTIQEMIHKRKQTSKKDENGYYTEHL